MEKITVILESKRYSAIGEYKDGEITIKSGSKLNPTFKENYAFSRKAKEYRESSEYVGKDFVLKKDITFSSPSTAAQFVLGYSANGWRCWRTENKKYIEVLKER